MSLDVVSFGVSRFVEHELAPFGIDPVLGPGAAVRVAGIGTTAARAVHGTLLAEAIVANGYVVEKAEALESPSELATSSGWQLGVVLSPFKREIAAYCIELAPSAIATGVVDTVIRTRKGIAGFNTNTWAAASALELLLGGVIPASVLVLGAGASSRSVVLAIRRCWPGCDVRVVARNREAVDALAREFAILPGDGDVSSAEVVVNATSWGETDASESEPLGIDLTGVLRPGVRLFDLNNRIGTLVGQGLTAGCAVVSGSVMQRVTNASRAALLAVATPT